MRPTFIDGELTRATRLRRRHLMSRILPAALVLMLALLPWHAHASGSSAPPAPASPELDADPGGGDGFSTGLPVVTDLGQTTLSMNEGAGCTGPFAQGADRLAGLQNDDGGWDWPLDDGSPTTHSPLNTIGPIGMGLSQAARHTAEASHLDALEDAGGFLMAKTSSFSPSDGYLAAELDAVLGGTAFVDHVTTHFYDRLANGTYLRNGTLYDTAGYVALIRTVRASQGIGNLAAWDIGMGLVGAEAAGADTSAWLSGLEAEIDELDGSNYYDVIGLAGAVLGLAVIGADYDPTAGEHAAASSLADLAEILVSYQVDSGGFTWNQGNVSAGEEVIQETAYAALALSALDRDGYRSTLQSAAGYMLATQLPSGGWEQFPGDGENNEVTAEALWALAEVGVWPEVDGLAATPNPVAAGTSFAVEAVATETGPGCAAIDSVELRVDDGAWSDADAQDGAFDASSEPVEAELVAPSESGIYALCGRATDEQGNTGETSCVDLVVYDPSGGFVTGGGWIDSPSTAVAPGIVRDGEAYDEDWVFNDEPPNVTPAAYTTDEASTGLGSLHVPSITNDTGNVEKFILRYVPPTEVVLDAFDGFSIDFLVDAAGSNTNPNQFYVNLYALTPDPDDGGWYDCRFDFVASAGSTSSWTPLAFDAASVATAVGDKLGGGCPTRIEGLPTGSTMLFLSVNLGDTSANDTGSGGYFDNAQLGMAGDTTTWDLGEGLGGRATFGFVSKYKKGASTPSGATQFRFDAAGLSFHSTSYDWLVINQGGARAQYKGSGTVNGQPAPNGSDYRFMLWAGDDDPDTFRMKIWWEDAGDDPVVYDNGADQAIGGGNIVVHKGK